MSAYHWDAIYDRAVSLYHGPAHFDTELKLIDHFERDPTHFIATVEDVGAALDRGDIRSGWGILIKRLEERKARASVTATDPAPKERTHQRAEQWMRNAGIHYDRWDEASDELFGHNGRLAAHPDLEPQLRDLWTQLRPSGEQLDRDELERAARWQTSQAHLATITRPSSLPASFADIPPPPQIATPTAPTPTENASGNT